MKFLEKENNQYTVVVTDPSQYTTLTGEGLVKA